MCTHKHTSIDWISTVGKRNIPANSLQFLDSNAFMNLCVTQRQRAGNRVTAGLGLVGGCWLHNCVPL